MNDIFVFGSTFFWALVAVEFVLLLLFTEFENGIAATVSILMFGAALQFMGDVDIISHFRTHPLHLVVAAVAYVLCGVGWLTWKWVRYVKQRLAEHDDELADFCERKGLPRETKVLPVEYRKDWADHVKRSRHHPTYESIADVPKIRNHKAKAMRWMTLWVFSLLLFVFKDMVRDAFNAVYVNIAGYLQRLADNIWSSDSIRSNLEIPEESRTK